MLGNEAVARGIYEGGVNVVASYPGTPSTEITEAASEYKEFYSEWSSNEKVAFEVALGASYAGARSFCAMKSVGLNVAADPFFTSSYTGVNGGMVIAVADDQGMHSSQNEEDSRYYAIAAKVPMLEPSDSGECLEFTKRAFDLSEKFDTPFMIRLSTRVSHSQSLVTLGDRADVPVKKYVKNMQKYIVMPAHSRKLHVLVEKRLIALREFAETSDLNRIEWGDKKIGVITSGVAYQYAKEALGDKASFLKIGIANPLPVKLIQDFASKVDKLYVIEELDDVIETHCKKIGVNVIGKEIFTFLGEYSAEMIADRILNEKVPLFDAKVASPVRPPVLCPGCPHRGLFYVLSKLKLTVAGDIGCYTLGAVAPLLAMDTNICMGASISSLHGMEKAQGKDFARKSVAVIGDSTFVHSGITGLIDVVYNKGTSTLIIADNSTTGMTGHQPNPTTGMTIKNEPTSVLDLEALCHAIGIKRVTVVDPTDLSAVEKVVKEEIAAEEPSVIITRSPCVMLKSIKPKNPP